MRSQRLKLPPLAVQVCETLPRRGLIRIRSTEGRILALHTVTLVLIALPTNFAAGFRKPYFIDAVLILSGVPTPYHPVSGHVIACAAYLRRERMHSPNAVDGSDASPRRRA